VKMRKALLALIGAVGPLALVLTAPGPAAAASSDGASAGHFAASATTYQNETIAKVMAREPGGTRVSASEVEWHHGAVIFGVPASPDARVAASREQPSGGKASPDQSFYYCDYGYSCVYSQTEFEGTFVSCESSYLEHEVYFCGLYPGDFGLGGSNQVLSWVNYTAYRAWLQENASNTDAGTEYCESPRLGNDTPNYDENFSGNDNTEDSYIFMSSNSSIC
jgi:hypothetical protein